MGLRRNSNQSLAKQKRSTEEIQAELLESKKAMYQVEYTGGIRRHGLVVINREYNLLRLPPFDQEVTSLVFRLLSFKKMIFDHIANSMRFETVDCYTTVDIMGRTCVICGAGIADELQELLERIGYEVFIADVVRQSPERLLDAEPDKERFIRALGEPREWQLQAYDAIIANRCGQICTATGSGKTTLTAALIYALPKARILFATRKRQALYNAYSSTVRRVPDAYMVKAHKNLRDKRLLFCSVGMLDTVVVQRLNFDWFFIDEHHETCTEHQMSRTLPIRSFKTFAFSAEYRNRADKADRWSDIAYGPLRLIRTYAQNQQSGDVVPVEVRWRNCEGIKLARDVTGASNVTYQAVITNTERNRMIAEDANRHPKKQTLVTVHKYEHALLLKQLLPDAIVACGISPAERKDHLISIGLLSPEDADTTEEDLQALVRLFAKKRIRLAICTPVWWQAVDFPQLEVVVRADGVSTAISINQITGRSSRTFENKDKSIIYDYGDEFNKSLRARARNRRKFYENSGFTQLEEEPNGY